MSCHSGAAHFPLKLGSTPVVLAQSSLKNKKNHYQIMIPAIQDGRRDGLWTDLCQFLHKIAALELKLVTPCLSAECCTIAPSNSLNQAQKIEKLFNSLVKVQSL